MMCQRTVAVGLLFVGCLAGCREPARQLTRGPAGSAGPRQLVEALAARFGPIRMDPGFEAWRPKLAAAVLVPSRVFDDPLTWTSRGDGWRGLELIGGLENGGYQIGLRAGSPDPRALADYRGRLLLRRTGRGCYEWEMTEELAVGAVRPADLAAGFQALLGAAESYDGRGARAAAGRAFPRASAVLSRLLRLEALDLARDREGATDVQIALRLTPAGLRATAPRYAEFLRKYVTPMKLQARAADSEDLTWWSVDGADNLFRLHLRVRDGRLTPLAGGAAARRIPGTLTVLVDYDTKMGIFGVGMRHLAAELRLARSAEQQGFAARFLQEPEWHLPFLVTPLIRGSLRYPFQGPGSELAFQARAQPGGPTILSGHYRARVRESWLLRWLGGLAGNALSEFRRGAEAEADRYHRECLLALRDDLIELTAP